MRHPIYSEEWLKDKQKVRAEGRSVKEQAHGPYGTLAAPSPITLSLTGQLVSGKNQVQLLWRNGRVIKYPNRTFKDWRDRATQQVKEQHCLSPISQPVRLTCDYVPGDLRTRDVSGQLDAIFHLLVHAKVLKDDGLVHSVEWTRHALNRKCPQVYLTLEPIG